MSLRGAGVAGRCLGLCAGIRDLPSWRGWFGCSSVCAAIRVMPSCFKRRRLAFFGLCGGIRALPTCFTRRPCAGRHLLFFAAAKKSRQKKAAHTASPCSYPRAPNVPTLHMTVPWSVLVANASNKRLTRFRHSHKGQRQRRVCAAQVANSV